MTTAEKLVKIAENVPKVFDAGKKAEHNAFWEVYIGKDGDIIATVSMFSGYRWTDDIYNPKHTIKASAFSSMYQNCPITNTKVALDVSNGSGTNLFFNATNLKNIVKLIVSNKNTFGSWFQSCTSLEEIRFEGVIANSLDIHWSTKLSTDSLTNIIEHLGGSASATLTLPTKFNSSEYTSIIANKPSNWTIAYL